MTRNKIAKIQHYVPQFLLKQFSSGKKPQVWVFDKTTGKKFKSHVKNVASEQGFYSFKFKGNELTIEPSLSNIEFIPDRVKSSLSSSSNSINLS